MPARNHRFARRTGRDRYRQSTLLALPALVAALLGGGMATAPAAPAADNPFERGPDPTEQTVTAPRGVFDTDTATVTADVRGFGGGTIYYPTDTSEGDFGAVAISPGFVEDQNAISWFGERLASRGFVVFTIDTNGRFDFPDQRADQLLAALDYLTDSSEVAGRIDEDRLGVMGHSMGGGGSLSASDKRPELRAAVPLAPWHMNKDWSDVDVPTMIIGAQNDFIAPVGSHSEPFYESLLAAPEKAYLEMRGGNHFVTNSSNDVIAKYTISWLKRFVDNDSRYEKFLCPAPEPDSAISEYRDTCPHSGA